MTIYRLLSWTFKSILSHKVYSTYFWCVHFIDISWNHTRNMIIPLYATPILSCINVVVFMTLSRPIAHVARGFHFLQVLSGNKKLWVVQAWEILFALETTIHIKTYRRLSCANPTKAKAVSTRTGFWYPPCYRTHPTKCLFVDRVTCTQISQ